MYIAFNWLFFFIKKNRDVYCLQNISIDSFCSWCDSCGHVTLARAIVADKEQNDDSFRCANTITHTHTHKYKYVYKYKYKYIYRYQLGQHVIGSAGDKEHSDDSRKSQHPSCFNFIILSTLSLIIINLNCAKYVPPNLSKTPPMICSPTDSTTILFSSLM